MARIRKERTIEVTQEDIDEGVPNDPNRCTIQLAVVRAFPEACSVKIANATVFIDMGKEDWIYRLPRNAVCIPIMIDEGLKEEAIPTVFKIKDPDIFPKKEKKPIKVKQHRRALPGEGDVIAPKIYAGAISSARARSAAARMRRVLKAHFGEGSRFAGIEL